MSNTSPQSLNMYNASVPAILRALKNLSAILDLAQTYITDKKISDETLLATRLYADMLPFAKQIQIVSDNAKGAAARLGGVEIPAYEDNEKTLSELKARLEKTAAFVSSVDPKGFEGSETKDIVLKFGPNVFPFNGYSYLTAFVLPNIYFHVSIAYAILRENGVPLGKSDYLGRD